MDINMHELLMHLLFSVAGKIDASNSPKIEKRFRHTQQPFKKLRSYTFKEWHT